MSIGTELYRKTLLTVAGNKIVRTLSIKYGKRLASRFISSDTLQGALAEVEALNRKGIMATLDHLGEGIKHLGEAKGYRDEYIRLIEAIARSKVHSNVSLKPTQMGLALNRRACYDNIRAVAAKAQENGNFVRLDMEDSPYTQATIDIVRRLHAEGMTNTGTVIQAYLYRSGQDVAELIRGRVRLRLVKGAYKEPVSIAYRKTSDVSDNFKKLIAMTLDSGLYTAIGSHDDRIIAYTKAYAEERNIPKKAFEFQMLYGLRMNEQERLAREGYRVRCYVPYGSMWYPYYTRRLAEKPANLWLVLKNMFGS
ncbi:proline dehydrogenase [Paenibacillus hemerocallicola]|uniref:proline dehydrogenase n=1 Tax=Paenibacillus hemerocallicola TaxID=1172614 RepID=A0A5C4T3R0_9BACL|nr:proline dehydrogenase family protein [Paenibacillus hemerocallicola]TNJ63698.1 proline dehydrogenase [Paenibacillus hemerocallicola]